MIRVHRIAPVILVVAACSSSGGTDADPNCSNCISSTDPADGAVIRKPDGDPSMPSIPDNGTRDGGESDVDCGGASAARCALGKACNADSDCITGACNYAFRCVEAPSCKTHLGGDTCGKGEVGEDGAVHEDCCRTLPVAGFTDAAHPNKKVYLDKYEVTAGRIRAWIEQLAAANAGRPDVKAWIAAHRPPIWDASWDNFLPSDYEGGKAIIARRLLGDPRPEDDGQTGNPGPGVILPPKTDEERNFGVNYQFGPEIYVDLHGNNCGAFAGSYGFPTYWYPNEILDRTGELPRPDGVGVGGKTLKAKDLLDVKSMNCITNAMLAAFCAWDGGQLATDEVLDYITATPATLDSTSGCGTQKDDHGALLKNVFTGTVQTGGKCPPVALVNATFDAGDALPVANSPLNIHNYDYPDTGPVTHDKSWQIASPGRASNAASVQGQQVDALRLVDGDEPWMDIHGNLNEAALDVKNGTFNGLFALKYRGIGYGSSRSDLNMKPIKGETVRRYQRPEAKAAYTGGRCMRFK